MIGSTVNHRCMFTTQMTLSLGSWSYREERAVRRPRHCHRQAPKAKRLGSQSNVIVVVYFLKFEQFKRLLGSTRLSYLKIPVETFTAPCTRRFIVCFPSFCVQSHGPHHAWQSSHACRTSFCLGTAQARP